MPSRARGSYAGLLFCSVALAIGAPAYWYGVESPLPLPAGDAEPGALEYEWLASSALARALAVGELPLWNAELRAGFPMHAVPQYGAFHPARALLLVMAPAEAAISTALLFLLVAGLGMLLLTRGMGLKWPACLFGAVAYAFGGSAAASMNLLGYGTVYALAPVVFWGLRLGARHAQPSGAVFAGFAAGVMLLAGAPLPAAGAVVLAMLWAGAGEWRWPPSLLRARRAATATVVLTGIAAGIAAVQWIPTVASLPSLENPAAVFATSPLNGQAPLQASRALRHLLAPESDLPPIGYMGAATLLFAPVGLAAARRVRRTAWITAIFTALLLAAAWSDLVSDLTWLDARLLLFWAAVPGALLAALGADAVFFPGRDPRAMSSWLPALLFVISVIVLLPLAPASGRGWILAAAAAALLSMTFRLRWVSVVTASTAALLVFAELYAGSVHVYGHPLLRPPAIQAYTTLWDALQSRTLGDRVLLADALGGSDRESGLPLAFPLRTAGGASTTRTRAEAEFWSRALPGGPSWEPSLIDYAAVRAVAAARGSAWSALAQNATEPTPFRLRDAQGAGGLRVLVNETALRRVHWTPYYAPVADLQEAVRLLAAPDFDPMLACTLQLDPQQTSALLEIPALDHGAKAPPTDLTAVRCQVTGETPNRVETAVSAPQPGVLVLADSFAMGWTAQVDGRPVPLLRANGLFRGVALPAGDHVVSFIYRPMPVYLGGAISALTLLTVILLCLRELFRSVAHTDE
jgi:hypothetical protein